MTTTRRGTRKAQEKSANARNRRWRRACGGAASQQDALNTRDSVTARGKTKRSFKVECVDYILCTPNPNFAVGSGRPFTYPTLPCSTARSPRARVHAASHPWLQGATMPVSNRSNSTNVGSHQGSLGQISESAQLATENFMMEPNISTFIYIFYVHFCFIHI